MPCCQAWASQPLGIQTQKPFMSLSQGADVWGVNAVEQINQYFVMRKTETSRK